ncbi:hypothetical protein X975_05693, partial [Stegodyphus mimosarum]
MFEIYVGNYPTHYTEDDVLNLFEDFEGIVLQRCFKKKQKSFCFLTCIDESQVIDVVMKMNKLVVDGRSLVVRAQDPDLQHIIENTVEKADTSPLHKHSDEARKKNTFQEQVQKTRNELCERFFSDCGSSVNIHSQEVQELSDAVSVVENTLEKADTSPLHKHSDETRKKNTFQLQVQKTRNKLCEKDELCERFFSDCGNSANIHSQAVQELSDTVSVIENTVEKMDTPLLHEHANETRMKNTFQQQVQKTRNKLCEIDELCERFFSDCDSSVTLHSQEVQELSDAAFFPEIVHCNITETASSRSYSKASGSSAYNYSQQVREPSISDYRKLENPAFEIYFNSRDNAAYDYFRQVQELSDTELPSSRASAMCSSLMNVDIKDVVGQENKEINYVCVSNFPLQTSVQDLFELFDDYDPVKIVMVCNAPRKDRRPTQALVCFSDDDNALDAIFNLDNTLYRGRILNVYDIKHISSLQDFINTGKKDCA